MIEHMLESFHIRLKLLYVLFYIINNYVKNKNIFLIVLVILLLIKIFLILCFNYLINI